MKKGFSFIFTDRFKDRKGRKEKYNLLDEEVKPSEDLCLYGYNPDLGNFHDMDNWMKFDFESISPEPQSLETLIVATQNIWFGYKYLKKGSYEYDYWKRFTSQLDTFTRELPHIIFLQEVTQDFLEVFRNHEGMRNNYSITDHPYEPSTILGKGFQLSVQYGNVILIRHSLLKSVRKVSQFFYPSLLQRTFIHLDLLLKDKEGDGSFLFNCGSVHLDSGSAEGNAVHRRTQLRFLSDNIQTKYENAMICGDFNFPANKNRVKEYLEEEKEEEKEEECEGEFEEKKRKKKVHEVVLENDFLKSEEAKDIKKYVDVWEALKYDDGVPSKYGYTKDSVNNLMLKAMGKKQEYRLDRIMMKSSKYEPIMIKLINDREIEDEEIKKKTYPSDHFGVLAHFRLKND